MKTKKLVLILMVAVLILNGSLFAHGGEEHAQMKSAEEMASPAAIWQDIREEEKELGEIIEAGKLGEVHEILNGTRYRRALVRAPAQPERQCQDPRRRQIRGQVDLRPLTGGAW